MLDYPFEKKYIYIYDIVIFIKKFLNSYETDKHRFKN